MKILITSFGPFNGFLVNPREIVLKSLHDKMIEKEFNHDIHWENLEVSYNAVLKFEEEIQNSKFDLIIHLGVATNESNLRFEMCAKNERVGKDVLGNNPKFSTIIVGKQNLYSNVKQEIVKKICLKHDNITKISLDAGSYLCNFIYYLSLSRFQDNSEVIFIHIADFINCNNAPSAQIQSDILLEFVINLTQ
jgi:pyrrolidone-carboxylate peptidase